MKKLLLSLAFAVVAWGQGSTYVYPARRFVKFNTLPATCTTGDVAYQIADSTFYKCATTNTWTTLGSGGGGSFSGPGSSTDNAVVRFDGTGGNTGQNSLVIVDDSGNITTPGSLAVGGATNGCDGTAGCLQIGQGTAPSGVTANTIKKYGPASITGYLVKEAAAAATGVYRRDCVSTSCTDSQAELSGDATTSGSNVVTVAKINGVSISGTPSTGYVPTATSSSTATWQAASGGSYSSSQGRLTGVSMTGSDVTLWTFSNVPALAAGACYELKGVIQSGTNAITFKIFADATQISTPITANLAGGLTYSWDTFYCNDAGVQNTQKLQPFLSLYYAAGQYAAGFNPTLYVGEGPATPTAVDWSTTHTITVKANATAGGTVTPYSFKID